MYFVLFALMLFQGYMDILVTTMNGNAFALQTMVPYEPILTWTEQNQCARNGGTWRNQYQGIYVLPSSRTFRDVIGKRSRLSFATLSHTLKEFVLRRMLMYLAWCGVCFTCAQVPRRKCNSRLSTSDPLLERSLANTKLRSAQAGLYYSKVNTPLLGSTPSHCNLRTGGSLHRCRFR